MRFRKGDTIRMLETCSGQAKGEEVVLQPYGEDVSAEGCLCRDKWEFVRRAGEAEVVGEFRMGERVKLKDCSKERVYEKHEGEIAEIVEFDDDDPDYDVNLKWEDGTTLWANNDNLIKVEEEIKSKTKNKKIMKKLTQVQKSNMSKDTQTLFKAEFIGSEMELTIEGKDALIEILFEANKAELVKSADAIVKEQEKNSK